MLIRAFCNGTSLSSGSAPPLLFECSNDHASINITVANNDTSDGMLVEHPAQQNEYAMHRCSLRDYYYKHFPGLQLVQPHKKGNVAALIRHDKCFRSEIRNCSLYDEGALLRCTGGKQIFLYQNATLRAIPSLSAFSKLKRDFSEVITISQDHCSSITLGANL